MRAVARDSEMWQLPDANINHHDKHAQRRDGACCDVAFVVLNATGLPGSLEVMCAHRALLCRYPYFKVNLRVRTTKCAVVHATVHTRHCCWVRFVKPPLR